MSNDNPAGQAFHMQRVHQLSGHNGAIFSVGPMEEDRFILSAGGDGWVARWDLAAPEPGKLIAKVETQLFAAHYLRANHQLILGNMNGGIHWVDLKDPEATRNVTHHRMGVFALQEVGEHILSLGGAGMLSRWEIESGKCLESLHLSNQSLRAVDYSPHRNELAIGSSDNNIYLLEADSLRIIHVFEQAHANSVFCLRHHPDGEHLLSGGRDAHLKRWSLKHKSEVKSLPAHWYTLNDLQFSPDGHWLATGSRDKTIKIWNSQTLELVKVLETARDKGHVNSVNSLFWSSYQNQLISGSDDRTLMIWAQAGSTSLPEPGSFPNLSAK